MGLDIHTIAVPGGMMGYANSDRVILGLETVAYSAGTAAGDSVTVDVTFTEPLPTTFQVFFAPQADVTAYASSPTAMGFTLNIQPRLATETIAAGSIGLLIVA
jgi:hypothetical protein